MSAARATTPVAVPILLYHSVSDAPRPGFDRWTVPRARFREQVAAIAESGRTALTVSDLAAALRRRSVPERAVVVTFDDGFLDTLDAVECLLDAGISATVYLNGGYLDQPDMLQRSDVATLAEAGSAVEIGAHSLTHRRLDELPPAEIAHELVGSRALVEDLAQRDCNTFAYPHGSHDRRTVLAVRATGYSSATAVKNALSHAGDDPFALARVTIEAGATTAFFDRTLNGRLRLARSADAWRTRGYRWTRRLARRTTRRATTS